MNIFLKRLAIVLIIASSFACFGQTSQSIYVPNGGYYDFAAVTSAGAGTVLDLRKSLIKSHTIEVSVTGTPSACTYRVEGSSNSNNWYDLSGTQACTSNGMIHIDPKPVRFLRINVITLVGTASLVFQWTGV